MNKMKKKVLMMTMAAATLSAVAQQPIDYVSVMPPKKQLPDIMR